jgi:inorganic phosphate transporter, PiT family
MMMVGEGLMPLSPVAAWVVVISQSIVLFLFSSITLEHFLASSGLPTIPLIPVSSSQAVVGSVIGIGLLKGGKGIRWGSLASIASGWVTTPIIAAIICFVALFFLQNVFNQTVYTPVKYVLGAPEIAHLEQEGVAVDKLAGMEGEELIGGVRFRDRLRAQITLPDKQERQVIATAEVYHLYIDGDRFRDMDMDYLSSQQVDALEQLVGRSFQHRWQLYDALASLTPEWKRLPDSKLNKTFNKHSAQQLDYVYGLFHVPSPALEEEKKASLEAGS